MRLSENAIPTTRTLQDVITLQGGLDQVTPNLRIKPGILTRAQNIEIDINQGYTSPTGYEAFDGRPAPSAAVFVRLDANITGSLSIGDVVDGATSSAQGTLIAIDQTQAGQSYLILTKVTGTFQDAEDLEVSAVVEAVAAGSPVVGSGPSSLLTAQYNNLAADEYRGDIAAPPGSGGILGIMRLGDTKYAVRNNAGGTAADLWKNTASGWSQIALGFELSFTSGGTTAIAEGDVIEGATSGATATITRVMLVSGEWADGDAAGKVIFASQTGTFQAENLDIQGGASNIATIAGDSDAITLLPDGRFESIVHNFGGEAGEERIYGVDGVNRGFEFDGTTFCPIDTGMTTDTPSHVYENKNHLFFSFFGSAQHSGLSTPYSWTVITGAAELALGENITNFQSLPGSESGGAMAIIAQNRVFIIYGSSAADWNLVSFRKEVGSYPYTSQELGMVLMLDTRGVKNLLTSDRFGNLDSNIESRLIQPWINERKFKAVGSCIARNKSQYRLFFSDKAALYITVDNNRIMGMTPQLLAHTPTCALSFENTSGEEEIYFGGSDGMVYQMEKGTSFDGEPISYSFDLPYHHGRSPRVKKRNQTAAIEVSGSGYHSFSVSQKLDYGTSRISQPSAQSKIVNFSTIQWDSGYSWDAGFVWDGQTLGPERLKLVGRSENTSLRFSSSSDYYAPLRFSSIQLRQRPGKTMR